jgi:hypothetical protein
MRTVVSVKFKHGIALVLTAGLSCWLAQKSALAITAELARKCQALVDRAYPLRVPGNPAAGHTGGTSQDLLTYYNKCVANGGEVSAPQPASAPDAGANTNSQNPK